MKKKREEYEKKAKNIVKTFKLIGISTMLLAILISVVEYSINRSGNQEEKLKNSANSNEYNINLAEDTVSYEKKINVNIEINNFNSENDYRIEVKNNDEVLEEINVVQEENQCEVTFNAEGKNELEFIIYKQNEEYAKCKRNVYYIKPYEKQFLDEYSIFGTQVNYINGSRERYEDSLKMIQNCGFKNIRAGLLLGNIWREDGIYNYGYYDEWIEAVNNAGINIVGLITNVEKVGGKDCIINSDDENESVRQFISEIKNKYGDKIKYFEILNEPNYGIYKNEKEADNYANLITKLYPFFNNIIVGATSGIESSYNSYMSSLEFFKSISQKTYSKSKIYSFHPYDIENYNNTYNAMNRLFISHNKYINEIGGFLKLYATEYGISSNTTVKPNGIDESVQADKLIEESVLIQKYNAGLAIQYLFRSIGTDITKQGDNYGIVNYNYVPKLAYYADKIFLQNTNGAEYIGSLNITNGLEAHTYDKDGHPLIIAWSNNTDNTYNFTLNQMTAKDIYGKEMTPDANGQIQITTSPVYLYNVPTNYFYQAISNTATTKYKEFTENYAEQISKVQGFQSTINTLNQRMKDLSSTSNLDETTSINLMKQHFNLGNTLIQAYKSGTLQIEYVKLSSMLDALNDIGNSFEDLVTVSAKTRNANISETLDTINKADNLINDNDIEMIYPSKILQFSQDFYDKASYINGLEEENDIKTGLIVSKNLHSKLLSDWATQFANLYIDTYIKNNPVTIDYSETNPTNQNVTATLRTNAQITINNNSNSKAYTFTQNGTFTFDYTIKGQTFQQTATVNNIDKTAPTIEGVENDRLYLSEVTPKASDTNLKEVLLYKDNNQVQNYQQNTKITEDGHYKLVAKDSAGNQTSVEFDISRNPAIIDYSEVNLTNQDVVATVNSNFDVNVKNNSNQKAYTFKENGEFTFELNIKGAELQLTAKVDNIDKTPPTITDVEDKKQYMDKVTPKISDDNLNEVKLYFDSEEVQGYTPNSEITGEGFYKLVAKDLAGNETSVEFTIIENPDEKYQIKDGNILNIKNNTNQDIFRKKLKMSGEYSIYRNDTLISDNDKIATGDKLRKSTGEEYTLIVSGDINNDGDVNIKDIVMLRKYLLERNNLDENSLLAADCNLDGKDISIKDLIRMRLIALERDVN